MGGGRGAPDKEPRRTRKRTVELCLQAETAPPHYLSVKSRLAVKSRLEAWRVVLLAVEAVTVRLHSRTVY